MNKTKRLFSLFLTMVLALTMVVGASAATFADDEPQYKVALFLSNGGRPIIDEQVVEDAVNTYLSGSDLGGRCTVSFFSNAYYIYFYDLNSDLKYKDIQGKDGALWPVFRDVVDEDVFAFARKDGVDQYTDSNEIAKEEVDETPLPENRVDLYPVETRPIRKADINIAVPKCGNVFTYAESSGVVIPDKKGQPAVTVVPKDAESSVVCKVAVDGDATRTYWIDASHNLLPSGTVMTADQEYVADVVLKADLGYLFKVDNYTEVFVNGDKTVPAEIEAVEGHPDMIHVYFAMTPAHQWDAGKVTTKPTLDKTGVRTYTCTGCKETMTKSVAKLKANTITVSAKTGAVKYSKLKKKTQTLSVKKVLTVSKNVGTVTYKKSSGNKKITINSKTGKVTVKKGLKKGTYKVKVKVTAAGNATYAPKTVTKTFKVKVK